MESQGSKLPLQELLPPETVQAMRGQGEFLWCIVSYRENVVIEVTSRWAANAQEALTWAEQNAHPDADMWNIWKSSVLTQSWSPLQIHSSPYSAAPDDDSRSSMPSTPPDDPPPPWPLPGKRIKQQHPP